MAVDITVPLNDDQVSAIRQARDLVAPDVTDADLVPLVVGWALDGIAEQVRTQVVRLSDVQARQQANAARQPIVAAIDAAFNPTEPDEPA